MGVPSVAPAVVGAERVPAVRADLPASAVVAAVVVPEAVVPEAVVAGGADEKEWGSHDQGKCESPKTENFGGSSNTHVLRCGNRFMRRSAIRAEGV